MAINEERGAPAYLARPGYVLREVAGEYLLIPVIMQEDLRTQMAVLNESGKFLWEQLQQERTMDQLQDAMTEKYDVTPEKAREDIEEFVTMLRKHQLIAEKGGR